MEKYMEYQNYNNPELGFEIKYPLGWIVNENPGFPAIIFVSIREEMQKNFSEMVSVFAQPYHESSSNFKSYSKNVVNRLQPTVQEFKTVNKLRKNRELGLPTYDFTYRGKQGPFQIMMRSLWTLYNNKIYTINFTAAFNKFDELEPIFSQIKSSFKIFAPKPITKEVEMKRWKDSTLASLDFVGVEKEINNLTKDTEIQKIIEIVEVFSLASMMADLKGFGPLNHLYPKFQQKLHKASLIKNLPEDIQWTLNTFNELAKKQNLI